MNYLLHPESTESDGDFMNQLEKLIKEVTELMVNFASAVDSLMAEALPSMGWSAKRTDS
jgi:hypothetical protein